MSNTRFQITTFDRHSSQFSRVADRSIHAGIKTEELPALLDVEPDSVELRTALVMTVKEGKKYSFTNKRGEFAQLEVATR